MLSSPLRSSVAVRAALALFASLLLALAPAPAAAQTPKPRVQRTATLGFYVFNVRDLDMKAQRFSADFYCWIRYRGEADPDMERIEFHNGQIEALEVQEREDKESEHYVCFRVSGKFQTRFSLQNYPLDRQSLEIIVEHPSLEADQLVYVHDDASYRRSPAPPDRFGIKNGLTVPDFDVLGTVRRVEEYPYETDFGHVEMPTIGSRYSRAVLSIEVRRIFWPYFYKVVVPFLILLACAYLAFWVPPSELVASVVLTLLALLSTIGFQMTIAQGRPETGYLILADKFFIATLFLILGALLQSMTSYNLERGGRPALALKLDVAARVAYPILFGSIFALLMWQAFRAEQ